MVKIQSTPTPLLGKDPTIPTLTLVKPPDPSPIVKLVLSILELNSSWAYPTKPVVFKTPSTQIFLSLKELQSDKIYPNLILDSVQPAIDRAYLHVRLGYVIMRNLGYQAGAGLGRYQQGIKTYPRIHEAHNKHGLGAQKPPFSTPTLT